MVGEPGLHGGGLVGGEGEDVGEAAAGVDDGFAGFFGLGDGGVGLDLRGADGGDVGAGAGEGGVEFARGAVVVFARGGVDALAAVAGDAVVARGVEHRHALEAEFHVFVALAHLVEGGQVGFVVGVGGRDDICGCVAAAVFGTGVGAWVGVRVGIYAVLGGVVAALVGAVGTVDGIEEVVEGCALDEVTGLVECHLLGVDQSHGVLQVEVRLAVVLKPFDSGLINTTVNGIENGRLPNQRLGEVCEKQVQIALEVSLGSIFNDAVAVLWVGADFVGESIKSTKAVGSNVLVAVLELVKDAEDVKFLAGFWDRSRTRQTERRTDLLSHFGLDWGSGGCGARFCWDRRALLDLGVVFIFGRRDLRIEVHRRGDEVDVRADMLRNVIGVAGDMRLAAFVFIDVVLRLQQVLRFLDCGVKFQPAE